MLVDHKFSSWFLLFLPAYDVFDLRHTIKASRVDLGVGRGGRGHLFSLKFCIFFIEFSEK